MQEYINQLSTMLATGEIELPTEDELKELTTKQEDNTNSY